MKTITAKSTTAYGHTVQWLECYRVGKSQYEGSFVYQYAVLVDGEREAGYESGVNSIREVRARFCQHLQYRKQVSP